MKKITLGIMAGIIGICATYFISCSSGETSTHPPSPVDWTTNTDTDDNCPVCPDYPITEIDTTGSGGAGGNSGSGGQDGSAGAGGDGMKCNEEPTKYQCKHCCKEEKWICIKECDYFCENPKYKGCIKQCVLDYWKCKKTCK